ncbi:hypothetical protein [Paraburkholderia terrae]|nr:hypothetical protein [Paraburkholderia terrae]
MMKIKGVTFFLALLSSTIFGLARAESSLCKAPESVIFSCSTERAKIIALCLDGRTNLISYRYGRPTRIELSYSEKMGAENGFFSNHYFRPSVDYTRITFLINKYEYSMYRNYDATEGGIPRYGVIVSENGDEKTQIKCQSRVIDNMSKIIKQLKCNEASALGCS